MDPANWNDDPGAHGAAQGPESSEPADSGRGGGGFGGGEPVSPGTGHDAEGSPSDRGDVGVGDASGPANPPPVPPPAPAVGPASGDGGRNVRRALATAVVVAVLAAGGGFAAGRLTHDSSPASTVAATTTIPTPSAETQPTQPPPLTGHEEEPAAAVARTLRPAMVQIQAGDGLGSGFVYDKSGLILTAAHVVGSDEKVTVRLADAKQVSGKVLGADTSTDVAVVKVDPPKDVSVAQLGVNVRVVAGQTAIAIGSPYGLYQTVTEGIISAVDRSVPTTGRHEVPMLQTDAPINPGNSGGALADRYGRVIGINDSIYSGTGGAGIGGEPGNVGVGFAIPIDLAKSVADRIVAGKPIQPGFLGVTGQTAVGSQLGAQIISVEKGSPADKAGLHNGDIVTALDGHPVTSMGDLAAAVGTRQPGDKVTLTYLRDGNQHNAQVTLGKG